MPVEVGDFAAPGTRRKTEDLVAVAKMFRDVSGAVEAGDVPLLRELIPDSKYMEPLFQAYADALPSKGSGATLWIEDSDHRRIFDGKAARERLAWLSRSNGAEYGGAYGIVVADDCVEEAGYVAGALAGPNFRERRMRLEAPGERVLDATYIEEYESVLLRNRRRVVQVRGDIRRDKNGAPVSVDNVDKIIEIDETPIEIREIVIDNVRYRAAPPLRFEVKFDSQDCLYDLQGDFGILVHAATRDDLEDMLRDNLDMLWVEYAQEDPEKLARSARNSRIGFARYGHPRAESHDDVQAEGSGTSA